MLKLIKLEWKKNNIGKYIRNTVILAAILCLFMFAQAYLGIANDPDTGVPDAAPGKGTISSPIELFTSMSFWKEENPSPYLNDRSNKDLTCFPAIPTMGII